MKKFNLAAFVLSLTALLFANVTNAKSYDWTNLTTDEYIEQLALCELDLKSTQWKHSLWPKVNKSPKPAFSEVYSFANARKAVLTSLQHQSVLKGDLGFEVTAQLLKSDVNRMANNTRDSKRLQELFDLFDNDATTISQCLSRPYLVEKNLKERFYRNKSIHLSTEISAQKAVSNFQKNSLITAKNIEIVETEYRLAEFDKKNQSLESQNYIELDKQEFFQKQTELSSTLNTIQETQHAYIYPTLISKDGANIKVKTFVFKKLSLQEWLKDKVGDIQISPYVMDFKLPEIVGNRNQSSEKTLAVTDDTWKSPDIPSPRYKHTAVWTGSKMIIWGGYSFNSLNSGTKYDPVTDSWLVISEFNAPSKRFNHSAVFTGTEMIIWGGENGTYLNNGARYNPATDTWQPITTLNAPSVRALHTAVYTGAEMIVWGGFNGAYMGDGARYNPSTNTWTTLPTANTPSVRSGHTAIFSGTKMVIWGGQNIGITPPLNVLAYLDTGAIYDTATNLWSTTNSIGTASGRSQHTAVLGNGEMVIWGGTNGAVTDTGAKYNIANDTWSTTSTTNAPTARQRHTAVFNAVDTEMIIWGGGDISPTHTGSRYDIINDSWMALPNFSTTYARFNHTAVYTGTEMIIWGGQSNSGTPLRLGHRYNSAGNTWTLTTQITESNAPNNRYDHSAIWTGNEMIIWGGNTFVSASAGGKYSLVTDTWTDIATLGQPSNRSDHTAIWTGTEMIIWGSSTKLNTGGRYKPLTDDWINTSVSATTATGRRDHTAVWTGVHMIIWGGNDSAGNTNTGAKYDPISDIWSIITTSGTASPRYGHSAVIIGDEMIVWGGLTNTRINTGAKFNFILGSWSPTSIDIATVPSVRYLHTAVAINNKMIIWGGNTSSGNTNLGAVYDPLSDTWAATSPTNAPSARSEHTAILNGSEMIIWGGSHSGTLASGGRYNLASDIWVSTTTVDAPDKRRNHTSISTPGAMIIFGGRIGNSRTNTSGIYYTHTTYNIGGMLSGLNGDQVILQNNSGDDLTLNANGNFTFPSVVLSGDNYDVTVLTEPVNPFQTCNITNAIGMNINASITNIVVNCVDKLFNVKIMVNGLAATNTVEITNNGGDNLLVPSDGLHTFTTQVLNNTGYNVQVNTQPSSPSQICTVTSPIGNISGADANLTVNCVTVQYDIGVTVTGLDVANTIELTTNGQTLNFSSNSNNNFPSPIDDGSNYAVVLSAQPTNPNQVCTITGGNIFTDDGSGTITGQNVAVAVACVTVQYNVDISVSGLAGGASVTFANAGSTSVFNSNTTQSIATLPDTSAFAVSVNVQPTAPEQICVFDNANSGNLAGANYTINVTCSTVQFDVNVNVSGLAVGNSVSLTNFADSLNVTSDGVFSITTANDETTYNVLFASQPTSPNQTCTFTTANSGNLAGNDAVINVLCVTEKYDVQITVAGLASSNNVSFSNGLDNANFISNQTQVISQLFDGSSYDIQIVSQPTTPKQTCAFNNASSGALAGAVVNVIVQCTTDKFNLDIELTGLAASNSVTFVNGLDQLQMMANGTLTLSNLDDESVFDVSIATQPNTPNQTCSFVNSPTGIILTATSIVQVTCTTTQYQVNVDVVGLASGNSINVGNGVDVQAVNSNGLTTISSLDDNTAYLVSILVPQPSNPNQICSLTSANSGVLNADDATVTIQCVTTQYNVNVTVSGLATNNNIMVVNGANSLNFINNSTQTLSVIDDGVAYAVFVQVPQPTTPNQVCSITNTASSNVAGNDVDINVVCVTTKYNIDVSVTGLATGNSISFGNGSDTLTLNNNTTQTLSNSDDGSSYNVFLIAPQPTTPNQTCAFTNTTSGTITSASVVINVTCTTNNYPVNINVSGLTAASSVTINNGTDNLTVASNGLHVLSSLVDGSNYAVSVITQPTSPKQNCVINSGASGTLSGSAVTIDIQCTTVQFNVDINVTGLAATNSISFANANDSLTITADGQQTLSTTDDGSLYNASIVGNQPTTPNQTCAFTNAITGSIASADIVINVTCTTNNYPVNINVSGLAASSNVTINNGTDNLTVATNGLHVLSSLVDGSNYAVSVITQPTSPKQNCVINSGASGTLSGSAVTIDIQCTTVQFNVDINVTGLAATNSISFANANDSLTITADGQQTLSTTDDGSLYNASIVGNQPTTPNQTCAFTNSATGTIASAVVVINVTCTTNQYAINANVVGLANGSSLILSDGTSTYNVINNGLQNLTSQNDGSNYNMTIATQPSSPNQLCSFSSTNSGVIAGNDVQINIECITTQYDINVTVMGLAASNSLSLNEGNQNLTISSDGTYTLNRNDDGTSYTVNILSQPITPDQLCTISSSSGTLASANVNLNIACTTQKYDVAIVLTGLASGTSVSFTNGLDTLSMNANGAMVLSNLLDESAFAVSISTQPTSPNQTCEFVNANTGNLSGKNYQVNVNCSINHYNIDVNVTGLTTNNTFILSNNGQTQTIGTNGIQTIANQADGSNYNVIVTSPVQPIQQNCIFTNTQSGTLAGADVTLNISCTTNQYALKITVSGLAASNSVSINNGLDDLTFTSNTMATLSTLNDGSTFAVNITSQPTTPSQLCFFTSVNSGTIAQSDFNINVNCVTDTYFIGGMVSGLASGNSVTLALGPENLTVFSNSPFAFINALVDESPYTVSVINHPTVPSETCIVTQASGTIAANDVIDVSVNCTIDEFSIGGTIQGLHQGSMLEIQNNNNETIKITQNGAFDFTQNISDLGQYNVTVKSQPTSPIQQCTITNGNDSIYGNNVSNIQINCDFGNDLIFGEGFE